MTRPLNQSDAKLIRSVKDDKCFLLGSAPKTPSAGAFTAANRADCARLSHRDLQALRPTRLSLCRRAWTRTQAIFVDDRANRRAPRLGYVPNAIYPKVAEFLGRYRTLQEMLNEICAINAELLRRRESLD